jgi:hypothetical protein
MNQLTAVAYQRVQQGQVAPGVIDELQDNRASIEQRLGRYSADGFIGDPERRDVNAMLNGMAYTIDRYQVRGGGPTHVGP